MPESIDCVDNPAFDEPNAERRFFSDDAATVEVPAWVQFPQVPDEDQSAPAARSSLSASGERQLFLQYNYARRRLAELLRADAARPSGRRARSMVRWYSRVLTWRARLVRANLALVVAMARRIRIPGVEFPELISEGNMALLRAVEKFDVSRGFKFSTYACRAILKAFHRMATKTGKYRQRFPTEYEPSMDKSDWDERKHEIQLGDSVEALREILSGNRANLSELERTVVMERYSIGSGGPGKTLAEVGKTVGLTNERVRQIQKTALGKIRAALEEGYLVA